MKHAGKFAVLAALLGIVAVVLMLFGAKLGLWQPIVGFGLYRNYMNPLGAVVTVIGLLALVVHLARDEKRGAFAAVIGVMVGLACLIPLVAGKLNPPQRAAPIHDISTDTVNPPMFEALDDAREGAANTLEYGGPELAATQMRAYPDIQPLDTDMNSDKAFQRALTIAADMDWEIVATVPERLRFEATTHTPVFHFADDIVIEVTQQDNGSRVDMRSVSRIGRGDKGVNAARIREFQARFME
ncbi:DUF1499 domain-containing protein [Paracoccus sp. JM45]|uniref:DUF1499 domain-containing protein n=1 Tax=Paracoccus sp. JM45 TaxID=2283626 RepID=UPI000E6CC1F7|nr:DUF1499 domain-containing protein [Paracoccus sp. JM45]RJE79144.1 DUF1499 domain-containing protein [Paracoccus sp. JM45]